MAVAANVICLWPSTNASIPSGWTRETSLDAKYIVGAATGADADLASSFGASSHTHTSPSHAPIQNAHLHTFSGGAGSGSNTTTQDLFDITPAPTSHTHGSVNTLNQTGVNNGVAITVDANTSATTYANDLVFVDVIFIKSDGTPLGIPSNAYAFFSSDTLPTSWTRVQGDKYLRGAAAGGNGGGTGGSNTHIHTSPAHTHTQAQHRHNLATSGTSSSGGNATAAGSGNGVALHIHTHSQASGNTTPTNQSVTTTIDSANHEPVFKKLNVINNGTGGEDLPDQAILLWGGTHAGIPASWSRFTSMDGKWIKGANANGESNVTTGGATTHTHTASACQPIQDIHGHSAGLGGGPSSTSFSTSTKKDSYSSDGHSHTWTFSNTTATNQAIAVTVSANTSESAYPPYQEVIFIQFSSAVTTKIKDIIRSPGMVVRKRS